MKAHHETTLTHPLITAEHLRRKAFIYIRQSSLEQVEKNTGSQAFQRNQIELAQAYGWPLDLIEFIDDDLGKSGSSADDRSGWQRMLDQIAANAVGAVFAVNISRLARQMLAFEELITLASYHGVLLFMDSRIIDPRDANDLVMSHIAASFAEYENKKRTEHMTRSRMAKAKAGAVVSSLPVGWIKTTDGKYDYDPEVKEAINRIIDTFMQVRSIRRSIKALVENGVKVPTKQGPHLRWQNPTLNNVRRLLINPAYTGIYIYGKNQSQRGGRVSAKGQAPRVKVPEHLWVKWPNHHPAYMSEGRQEEIKLILKTNHFKRRNRIGRGPALTQGLLRCALCKRLLSVNYHRGKSYSYGCGWDSKPCTRFISYEFDQYVLDDVFKVLETPPLEMLRAALEESRSQERARLDWVDSERERLEHEERRAQERVDRTHDGLPRSHRDALQKLENILQEKDEFEQKIAREQSMPKSIDSEEELEELCRLASDVPGLWRHATVTNQERKEILRCLIDHIVVAATKVRIDATICWRSGQQTSLAIWRGVGRYNLIRELHEQKLTVFEIKDHLAAGQTSTGQKVNITAGRLYDILHKLGLEPNRFSTDYLSLREKALTLNRDGKSIESIAEEFNRKGCKSASGKPWTRDMVYGLLRAQGKTPLVLEEIHREAITEARARGLNYKEMAIEFNEDRSVAEMASPGPRATSRTDGPVLTGSTVNGLRKDWSRSRRPRPCRHQHDYQYRQATSPGLGRHLSPRLFRRAGPRLFNPSTAARLPRVGSEARL